MFNKMKHVLVFVFIFLFSALLIGCSKQTSQLDAIKTAGVIKVGTSADYPPFEYVDDNGNKIGFDIELMQEIARRMGVKLEWVDMPFDSLIASVQEGKIDAAIAAFNYSEERDANIDFTEAYYLSEDAFVVADSFADEISAPEDAAKYIVGVQTGTTQDSWLTENLVDTGLLTEDKLFRYDRADQAALDLKNGRIQVWVADYVPGLAVVNQLGGLKVVYKGILSSGPMNIIIPEGSTDLAAEMNKAIAAMQGEGFIDGLALKYIGGMK
jgi:polar amino acid transport system substrate-binding protein